MVIILINKYSNMSSFRIFGYFVLFLVLSCKLAYSRPIDKIKKSGKLVIAFDPADRNTINYPLAYEFAKFLDLEVEEVIISWDEVFSNNGLTPEDLITNPVHRYTPDALKKADIICSTFTILEWRKRLFDFAETIISAELLVMLDDVKPPDDVEGLKGMKIAMMKGTSYVTHMKQINEKIGGGIEIIETATSEESKDMLKAGSVDGIILDADEALSFRKANNMKFKLIFPVNQISKSAWAIEKGNPLKQEVENFFRAIENNNVLDRIFEEKFGEKYSVFVESIDPHAPVQPVRRDLDEILKSRKLVIALRERDFVYHKGGEKQFMHVLAEEFADYMGVKMEYVLIPKFGKYWEDSKRVTVKDSSYTPEIFNYFDIASDLIAPLEWRKRKVDLIPVYHTEYSVLARAETEINSIEDLKKYKGITGEATIYEELLLRNGIDSLIYGKVNEFIDAVVSKRADYTIIYNAFLYPQLEPKISLGGLDVCWALRKDQPELRKITEKFIQESSDKGLLNALNRVQEGKAFLSSEEFIKDYYEKFQTGYLPYILYGTENGLPQEDISSIIQDKKGYMWFGTNSGVVRYNGRDMEVFDIRKGMSANSISDIKEDAAGTIYFATSKGISIYENDSIIGSVFPDISFNSIFVDKENNKWFFSNEGIYMLDKQGKQRLVSHDLPQLPKNINAIAQDTSGLEKYFATNNGLFYQSGDGKPERLLKDHCYTVFIDASNYIWLSTSDGFFHVSPERLKQGIKGKPLNRQFSIPFTVIKKISQSKSGSIWFMNDSHLYQVVSMDQQARIFKSGTDLMNNTVLSYWEDNEGNLWIGFSGGLQRIINNKNLRNFYPETLDNYIYSIAQDRLGRIWIGTNDGLYHFQNTLMDFSGKLPGGSGKTLVGILPNKNILFATMDGLFEYNVFNLNLVRQNRKQVLDGLENIFISPDGEVFVLTGKKGLVYYYSSLDARPLILQNKLTASVYKMVEYKGELIGGSSMGLTIFDGSSFKEYMNLGRSVWSLCENEGRLWVGTDRGIGYIEDGEFRQIKPGEENRVIKTIIPAISRNHFWIGTNTGLAYFNKETQKVEFNVNSKEGLSGDEITANGLFLDENGLLWIGTYHGISNFNIKIKKDEEYSPRVYLEKVTMNGEEIDMTKDHKFKYNENNFIFEVSGLSYSDEKSIEYEFYLRGLKEDYNFIRRGNEFKAYYTNNPPGKYTFVYRAKGKDNVWSYTQSYSFEIKKPIWETWVFRILALVILIFLINLVYKLRVQQIHKQKRLLEIQVRERTIDLEQANKQIQKQRDVAREQRDQIGVQKKEITDSIHYAERIQRSVLPASAKVKQQLTDGFILFKPRDIVSGDFYWFTEVDHRLIIVAADCTGHGVPGAFMSMLGISFLNEIVNKNHIHDADLILNHLRDHIIEALQQKGKEGEAKDGMDMAICVIHKETKTLQFAGANNPLYIIRNGELEHIKGDKMPVAIHLKMQDFEKHEIKYKEGDTFYIFSDGFADQFGGTEGKKFKYKPFKDLLVDIYEKPMEEQEQILDKTFEDWKGEQEQLDDVVILGFRL